MSYKNWIYLIDFTFSKNSNTMKYCYNSKITVFKGVKIKYLFWPMRNEAAALCSALGSGKLMVKRKTKRSNMSKNLISRFLKMVEKFTGWNTSGWVDADGLLCVCPQFKRLQCYKSQHSHLFMSVVLWVFRCGPSEWECILTFCDLPYRVAQVIAELDHTELAEQSADLWPGHIPAHIMHSEGDLHWKLLLLCLHVHVLIHCDVQNLQNISVFKGLHNTIFLTKKGKFVFAICYNF